MSELSKMIKEGYLKFPNTLSLQIKDLLSNMLLVNPNKRLTLLQVLQHEIFLKRNKIS